MSGGTMGGSASGGVAAVRRPARPGRGAHAAEGHSILPPTEIRIGEASRDFGWVYLLDCEVVGSYLIVALKSRFDDLRVLQYRP
jgi:hypothetical protein